MPRSIHLRILLTALIAACSFETALAQEGPNPDKQRILELIKQLGVDKYRDREAAQQALLAREDAYLDIRKALPSLNAEGQRRARAILFEFDQRRIKQFLHYGREGRLDVFVEWSSLAGKTIDAKEYWQTVLDISWERLKLSLSETESKEWMGHFFPAQSYELFLNYASPFGAEADTLENVRLPMRLLVRSTNQLTARRAPTGCVLVTSKSAKFDGLMHSNILVSNGDISVEMASQNLIVADGNVNIRYSDHNVIVARGKISVGLDRSSQVVRLAPSKRAISNNRQNESPEYDLLYRPGRPPRRIVVAPREEAGEPESASDEPPASHNDKIRFFELSDIGIDLTERDGELRVTNVDADSPLAKSGLRIDDVIVAVDGVEVTDVSAARLKFRRAFVLYGAEFAVSRDGKRLSLEVSFYGWELPGTKPAATK